LGAGVRPKPPLAHLVAKAAQGEPPVDGTPEALQQRRNARAGAFLRAMSQTAFPPFHTADPVGEEALFAAFGRVHSAERTGFGLPQSRKGQCPGAGGSGTKAGAKIQLGGLQESDL
jgi:hypothetical protein